MQPLPFQLEDGAFLLGGQHRALWSEPGTGKTLAAAVALGKVERSLIVAPASATRQWVQVLRGRGIEADVLMPGERPLCPHMVVSWGLVGRGAVEDSQLFDVLLLDEAHKAVRLTAQRTAMALALIRRAQVVWPLTGTPMIRYADDLWPLCNALWPDHLADLGIRSRSAFLRRFCTLRDGLVVGSRQFTLRTLHETLMGARQMPKVVVRRTLAEVAPLLPAVTSRTLMLPLTRADRKRLDSNLPPASRLALETAEASLERDEHIATVRRALGVLKAPEAAELLRDAPGKVIAVYWHTEVGDLLSRYLEDVPQVRLDGSTPQAARQAIVDAFNRPQGPKVFLLQMVAGGEAINPHEHCSHLVFVERDWSGATMEQALRRVRRMGQTRHQQIDFLDADHPVDYAMRRFAARKSRDLAVLTGDAA